MELRYPLQNKSVMEEVVSQKHHEMFSTSLHEILNQVEELDPLDLQVLVLLDGFTLVLQFENSK